MARRQQPEAEASGPGEPREGGSYVVDEGKLTRTSEALQPAAGKRRATDRAKGEQ